MPGATELALSADLKNTLPAATMRPADMAVTIQSDPYSEPIAAEHCATHACKIGRQWGAGALELFGASDTHGSHAHTTDTEMEHDVDFSRVEVGYT